MLSARLWVWFRVVGNFRTRALSRVRCALALVMSLDICEASFESRCSCDGIGVFISLIGRNNRQVAGWSTNMWDNLVNSLLLCRESWAAKFGRDIRRACNWWALMTSCSKSCAGFADKWWLGIKGERVWRDQVAEIDSNSTEGSKRSKVGPQFDGWHSWCA